jgi:glycosyltransferase involved in cell wall biosynthesis
VNGRFLSIPQTGVQRVARQMLWALAALWREGAVVVAVPPGADEPVLPVAVRWAQPGRLQGLLWEQLSLPRFAGAGVLVNLCNLGPLFHSGVLMIHDAQVFITPQSYSWLFRHFYRVMQPLMARRARVLVTVSSYSRDMLVRYGVAPAGKIEVIHNGADHLLAVRPDPEIVPRLGLRPGGYVLAMASTQRHKNIGVLLRAFAEPVLAGAVLVLAGAADAADFAAAGLPCPAHVIFAGRVRDESLRALMEGAACLAFPSTTEGFGLPPMEAMSLGCPAVVAPCGAIPEICGAAAVYVEPDDAPGWAAAMAAFIGAPERRALLGARGQAHAAGFTWARSAEALAAVLREVAG